MLKNQFNLEKLAELTRTKKNSEAFKYVEAFSTLYNLTSASYEDENTWKIQWFYIRYNDESKELFQDSGIIIDKREKISDEKEILILKQNDKLFEVDIRKEENDKYFEFKIELATLDKYSNKHRKVGEWIPTKDMTPEERVPVLVTYFDKEHEEYAVKIMVYCPYGHNGWQEYEGRLERYDKEEVIAWKPLDKPYIKIN